MNCCTLPFFYVAASLYVSYNSGLRPAHLVPVIFPHSENTLATVASAYLHDPAFLDCHNPDKTEPVQVADVLEHIRKILFQRNVCATVSVPVPNSWRFTREIFRQPRTLLRVPAGETHNTSPPRKFSQIHIKEIWIWNQSLGDKKSFCVEKHWNLFYSSPSRLRNWGCHRLRRWQVWSPRCPIWGLELSVQQRLSGCQHRFVSRINWL